MARQLIISLVADSAKFSKGLDEASSKADKFGKRIGRVGTQMTKFVTVPIVGFLGASAKAAAEEEQQMKQLEQTLKQVTGATSDQVASVEKWIGRQQDLTNFSDGEQRPALMNLVRATGDLTKAQDLMTVAMDISKGTGRELGRVTEMLGKAYLGNATNLERLGITTRDAEGQALSFEEVMRNATAVFGGQATEAAKTTSGQFERMKNDMSDLQEELGAQLLPAFVKLAGFLNDKVIPALQAIGGPNALAILLAAALAGPLLKSIQLVTVAWRGMTVAAAAFNVTAAPLLLTLGAIASALNDIRNVVKDIQRGGGIFESITKPGGFLRGVIPNRLPFFHEGGVVPGPTGANVPIMAQAGETVVPRGGGGGGIHIHINGNLIAQRDLPRMLAQAAQDARLIGVS